MMQIRIFPFGVLKDCLGTSASTVELPANATVKDLLELLSAGWHGREPLSEKILRTIAVSVNAEYATATQVLRQDDEVGLLPPVSGGSDGTERHVALTSEPIRPEIWIANARQGEDGALVIFDGVARNNSNDRQTLYLDYEAFHELAIRQMEALVTHAIEHFGIRDAWIIHRLGRVEIGETSVLIVVASAHRAQAFDACRWLIDALKTTVPIWKKETFTDGAVWAAGEPFPVALAVTPPEAPYDA
jgi:molybdopterin synthase catalytic subunit/molybdopterin converting factor small subunit